MPPEVLIEHRYPAALAFLRAHGPQALAVLHDLLARAEHRDGALVARASTRDIADRLQLLSKDTVHRTLRQLARRRERGARPPIRFVLRTDDLRRPPRRLRHHRPPRRPIRLTPRQA